MRLWSFLLLLSFLLLSSCSSQKKIMDQHLVSGSCENQFKKVKLSSGEKLWENIQDGSSIGASYMVTGLSYSTDVIVTFSGTLIGTVAVCSPLLLADGMARASGVIADECLSSVGSSLYENLNPKLGAKAHKATTKWRCPRVDSIAEALLSVATCYQKNDQKDLAVKQIAAIDSSEILTECLSDKLKEKVSSLWVGLQ